MLKLVTFPMCQCAIVLLYILKVTKTTTITASHPTTTKATTRTANATAMSRTTTTGVPTNLSEDTRYDGDPEPTPGSSIDGLIDKHSSNKDKDCDDTTHGIPNRLRPLVDLLCTPLPAKTYHEELVRCALPTSRAIADYTTSGFGITRPLPPFMAEVHSRRSRQRRIFLFTIEPKIGHYALMCKSTDTVFGAMEVRYHESHPMASVDSARNHCDYLYEGLVHDTKTRPFTLLFKVKVERAIPIGNFEALHEDLWDPFFFTLKCLGHYDDGIEFPLTQLD